MHDVAELRSYLEPVEGETIGHCAECGQDILAGEDVWEIKGNWYCEQCIDNSREIKYGKENYFENVV